MRRIESPEVAKEEPIERKAKFLEELDAAKLDAVSGGMTPCQCGGPIKPFGNGGYGGYGGYGGGFGGGYGGGGYGGGWSGGYGGGWY